MNLLIFKTNIESDQKAEVLGSVLDRHPIITKWSIDTEDVDNVLKVESQQILHRNDVISIVEAHGFNCEELLD